MLEAERKERQVLHAAHQQSTEKLNQTIADLQRTIADQTATIGQLLEENRLLRSPKKNSRNSSIPPSKDENRPPKTKSLRWASGKKPGGQKGHEGNTLQMVATPDEVIEYHPSFCNSCGNDIASFTSLERGVRQVVDIPPIKPIYTEHRIFSKQCSCGHVTCSSYPSNVNAPISYGNNVAAQIAYLHSRQYLPMGRMAEYFNSVYNLPMSQGTICNILERFATNATAAYELIKKEVELSAVVGADETGMKVNGKLNWFWVWQSKTATFITASANRAFETVSEHFSNGFPNTVLVHDCWSSHLNTVAANHQLCLAHLLRELTYLEEKYQCTWSKQLNKLFLQALELKKSLSPKDYDKPIQERAMLEAKLFELIHANLAPPFPEVLTFQKRMIKHKDYLFTFLYHHDVPADNNASERGIRNIKVKQKVSNGFRSWNGANIYAIIRSVAETCIKSNQSIMEAFRIIADLKTT